MAGKSSRRRQDYQMHSEMTVKMIIIKETNTSSPALLNIYIQIHLNKWPNLAKPVEKI